MSSRPDAGTPALAFPRLYAILDLGLVLARGLAPRDVARLWLDEGVRLLQLRAKSLTFGPFATLAADLTRDAAAHGATFIVNDRADVAAVSGAGGVHVGQADLAPAEVRRIVGAAALVGLSTHTDVQVEAAAGEPISYLAIGPVLATTTKAHPDPEVGLAGVRRAVALAGGVPVVAIGGLTVADASAVFQSGAASLAVASGLLAADLEGQVRRWLDATTK